MTKQRRFAVNHSEGDCFLVTLEHGGYIRGVLARANSKNYSAFSYFFLPQYNSVTDAVIDDYLTLTNAICANCHSDWGLRSNRWKIIGKISPWVREDWPLPIFGSADPVLSEWGELRYRNEKTLELEHEEQVPIDKVIHLPEDGACGDEVLDGILEIYMKNLSNVGIDPCAIPPQDITHLYSTEQLNTRNFNKGFVPLFSTVHESFQSFGRQSDFERYLNAKINNPNYMYEKTNPIEDILWKLLSQLETLAESHNEVFDNDVREQLHLSIWEGFVLMKKNYILPSDFKMSSKSGNRQVRSIIKGFLELALQVVSEEKELQEPLARLKFFQDDSIESMDEDKKYYEFFGHLDEKEAQKKLQYYEEIKVQSPKDSINLSNTNKAKKETPKKKWDTNPIKKPLQKILNRLDTIAQCHGEVTDTDVRDVLHSVVWDGFIDMKKNYSLPDNFAMFSKSGNKKVRTAIEKFLESVRILTSEIPAFKSKKSRFEAFQDIEIQSKEGSTYDDYFGDSDEC
jgi:hypothetical protein